MDKQSGFSVEMRIPVTTIEAAALNNEIVEEIATIMQGHGGRLETAPHAAISHFPLHTYKTLTPPELQGSKCIIHFPDGTQAYEWELPSGQSSIVFVFSEFSLEF